MAVSVLPQPPFWFATKIVFMSHIDFILFKASISFFFHLQMTEALDFSRTHI